MLLFLTGRRFQCSIYNSNKLFRPIELYLCIDVHRCFAVFIEVIDCDLGHSGKSAENRDGFKELVAIVANGMAGAVACTKPGTRKKSCIHLFRSGFMREAAVSEKVRSVRLPYVYEELLPFC